MLHYFSCSKWVCNTFCVANKCVYFSDRQWVPLFIHVVNEYVVLIVMQMIVQLFLCGKKEYTTFRVTNECVTLSVWQISVYYFCVWNVFVHFSGCKWVCTLFVWQMSEYYFLCGNEYILLFVWQKSDSKTTTYYPDKNRV